MPLLVAVFSIAVLAAGAAALARVTSREPRPEQPVLHERADRLAAEIDEMAGRLESAPVPGSSSDRV